MLHSEPWSVVLVNSVDVEPGTVDVTAGAGASAGQSESGSSTQLMHVATTTSAAVNARWTAGSIHRMKTGDATWMVDVNDCGRDTCHRPVLSQGVGLDRQGGAHAVHGAEAKGSARPAGASVAELARSLTMAVKWVTTLLVLESEVSGRSGKSRTVPRRERRR